MVCRPKEASVARPSSLLVEDTADDEGSVKNCGEKHQETADTIVEQRRSKLNLTCPIDREEASRQFFVLPLYDTSQPDVEERYVIL